MMAATHADTIRQAVRLAREGHPSQGLALLLESPVPAESRDASLYHYTLGWLLAQQDRPGEAFSHLDFAHRHHPGDALIQQAWERTRTELERKQGVGSLDRASTPVEQWVDSPYSTPTQALFAVLALVACAGAARKKQIGRWTLLLWLLAFGASALQFVGSRNPQGRALSTQTLRSGPSEDFLNLGSVEAGSELRIIESKDGWSRVRISPESSGWVPHESVLLLMPPSTTRER